MLNVSGETQGDISLLAFMKIGEPTEDDDGRFDSVNVGSRAS